jgi:hypothetical protein
VAQFKNNRPGWEWCHLYLERHPALKEKVAHNISRKRAQVDENKIKLFFQNLEKEVEGVSPDNIYNVDETGFHDDPGRKKLLFRRSSRHPELIRNATKSCYTVVFCGNASGELIPPFFIFKGKPKWSDWLINAPEGSRMSTSASGWMEIEIYEEWLLNHFVPNVKKVLLCDNLSAHISLKTLEICRENNISLICLVPNSTHLLQPLDVGYFSSLKANWRTVLNKWRQTARGKKMVNLPKNLFSQFVKATLQLGKDNDVQNMKAGFRATGIYPFNPEHVLDKLPKFTVNIEHNIGESFKKYIDEIRSCDLNYVVTKKFQLPITAGKSVSAEEVAEYYKARSNKPKKDPMNPMKRGRPTGSKNKDTNILKKKFKAAENPTGTPEEPLDNVPTNEIVEDFFISEDGELVPSSENEHVPSSQSERIERSLVENNFYLINYEESLFPGQIKKIDSTKISIRLLQKNFASNGWIWPSSPDFLTCSKNRVVHPIPKELIIEERGIFIINDDMLLTEWGD